MVANIRDRIAAHQTQWPNATAAEIAAALGVSRQRIYQGLAKYGMPVARRSRRADQPQSQREIARTGGVQTISTRVSGQLAELLAAVDLVARGYQVYRPMIDHRSYDLITVTPAGDVITVEVRTARILPSGALSYTRASRLSADVFALVVHGHAVRYDPADRIIDYAIGGSRAGLVLRK